MASKPFASRRTRGGTRAQPRRLHVESLEDRRLLASLLALTDQNQLLRFDNIEGTLDNLPPPVDLTGKRRQDQTSGW